MKLSRKICATFVTFIFIFIVGLMLALCSCAENKIPARQANHDQTTPDWLANYKSDKEFNIMDENQLLEFTNFVNGTYKDQGNFSGKKVNLRNDLCLNKNSQAGVGGMNNATEFWPIGDTSQNGKEWFAGEFNGNGHTICGLYNVTPTKFGSVGFFAGINDNAYIHDIAFKNSYFECVEKDFPSAIIPCISAETKNIKVENIFIGEDVFCYGNNDAGGILGISKSDQANIQIKNCAFMGHAKSDYRSTEKNKSGEVTFCSNTGGMIANAGKSSVVVSDCLGAGNITGGTNSSGIVGNADSSTTIINCIDVADLSSGSKKWGYRLFGGTSNQSVNSNLIANNNIYMMTLIEGDLVQQAGFSNNTEINDITSLVDCNPSLLSTFQNWENRSFGETCSDIPIPKTIAKFSDNSTYKMDNIDVDKDAFVNSANENSMFFTYKFKKSYIANLLNKNDAGTIKFGSLITEAKNISNVSDFTIENLDKKSNVNDKIYQKIENPADTVTVDKSGFYYTTQNQIKEINEKDYDVEWSTISYVKIGDEIVYSPNYITTSISEAAWKEISDVRSDYTSYYNNKIKDEYFTNEYSPYNEEFRQKLLTYIPNKPIKDTKSDTATPEEVGLDSQEILNMFEDMKIRNLATHTTMIMRHGKIVTEKYANGYTESSLQRMYSVSKSLVGMSMGILLNDPKYDVKIDDPVGKYFPEYAGCDPVIYNTTIKQCLTMTTPFNHGVYEVGDKDDHNWVEKFFTTPKDKDPNANEFWYDTCGAHLVGVIVERVTGKDFWTYAREQVFSKTGTSEDTWCVKAPEDYAWAGSGVMMTTRDMLNIGNMIMSGGSYKGQQLMDAKYTRDSIKYWIDDSEEGYSLQDGRGYGYYIWLTDIGFAFEGMGNQLVVCMPDEDIVFCCTSDNQGYSNGYHDLFDLINRHLKQNAYAGSLPQNTNAYNKLKEFKLVLPTQPGEKTSSVSKDFNNKKFSGGPSDAISEFSLDFDNGRLNYTCHGEENKVINFAYGDNKIGNLNETSYSWKTINVPMTVDGRNDGYRIACSGAWKDTNTFVIYVQVIDDYLANMKMTFQFDDSHKTCTLTNKYTAEGFLKEYKMQDIQFKME